MNITYQVIKNHILDTINREQLIGSDGEMQNIEKWISFANELPVGFLIGNKISESHFKLTNESLRSFLNLESQVLGIDDQFDLVSAFEPTFLMFIYQKHLEMEGGGVITEQAVSAFLYGADQALHDYNCFSFGLQSTYAEHKYFVHLFCHPNKMRLLKAYSRFNFFELTPRQKEVLEKMILGLSKKEVSEELSISIRTVEKHFEQILTHGELSNQAELINAVLL